MLKEIEVTNFNFATGKLTRYIETVELFVESTEAK